MDVRFETKHGNVAGKDEWLTPPELIKKLGEFDLDPCSPINRPWDTAKKHYSILDDGLMSPWEGRVWCNPPYGKFMEQWLMKCSLHKNVTALTFSRTDTNMFHEWVFKTAHSLLFIKGRLSFYHVTGEQGDAAGAPSVLISYNEYNSEMLKNCGIKGKFVYL